MKPTLPQGTRDFAPEVIRKRNYILQTIRNEFELFGYEPLETPAFENLDTLLGKYGDEGDKLIFKILNNGFERPEKHAQALEGFQQVLAGKNVKGITERAMKYDLTIPFARFVAMNKGQLILPFKRYQIQPVWRADRPQRGRYREFTQCDADVVGSTSLINEIELIQIYLNVFKKLGIEVQICVNNRKILSALATSCGGSQYLIDITVAIDKLDKIGIEKVSEELRSKNIQESAIDKIHQYLSLSHSSNHNEEILEKLHLLFEGNEDAKNGLSELQFLINNHQEIKIDVTLARGLNYYTGTILEVKPLHIQMGSIGGGGRYDDLTGLFDVPDVPGVGISFGVDRIYDVMEEKKLFPSQIHKAVDVMLVNFGNEFLSHYFEVLKELRAHQISCELYPDVVKFDKQMKYANKKNISYVVMIGENELKENVMSVKNFQTGVQQKLNLKEFTDLFK